MLPKAEITDSIGFLRDLCIAVPEELRYPAKIMIDAITEAIDLTEPEIRQVIDNLLRLSETAPDATKPDFMLIIGSLQWVLNDGKVGNDTLDLLFRLANR